MREPLTEFIGLKISYSMFEDLSILCVRDERQRAQQVRWFIRKGIAEEKAKSLMVLFSMFYNTYERVDNATKDERDKT